MLALMGELTLLALVGIVDPPRPAAKAAIATAHHAGIQVRMITGDHAVTAEAIARQLGITGRAITGAEFAAMDEAEVLRHEAYPVLDKTLRSGTGAEPDEFDYHPPVILMKGNGPFIISTRSEREIVGALTWKSFFYIWGGPAAALWGLWQIFTHAKAAGLLPDSF